MKALDTIDAHDGVPTATIPRIPGAEKIVSVLGRWPSFHDAEVLRFTLSRGTSPDERVSVALLDVQVRAYAPTNMGTAAYVLALVKDVVIRFAFEGVADVKVEDFNFQNVINSLTFTSPSGNAERQIQVEIESIFGFGASWLCRRVNVEIVTESTAKSN